jgi:hypothetical protein
MSSLRRAGDARGVARADPVLRAFRIGAMGEAAGAGFDEA